MSALGASSEDPSAWIDTIVADDPSRPFLVTAAGERLTYRDLDARTARIGAALSALGVEVGDRVAVQVEKSPEAFLLGIACLRLGAVLVPLNTAYTPAELDYFVGDAQPRLVVCDPHMRDAIGELARRHGDARVETLDAQGQGTFAQAVAAADAARFRRFAGDGDALAALLYTSGTTGRSKGAMITRRNLASNAVALVEAWRLVPSDVMLHALPIFHVHGLFISGNAILAAGASFVFLPKFDAADVLRRLRDVTVLMGVPTFYTRLLQLPGLDRAATAGMRLFVSGSAPLLAETHREFEARTGHGIVERYGMTETQINASNPYDGARVPGAVGFPLPGVTIRITDLEKGVPLATGETGMIEVRGPNVFRGYWRNPEKTAADLKPDGFFRTGDVGRFDERGYLFIVGRAKDLVITGGYNVYPIEVETEIDQLPGVVESAVIGVPHPDFGEGVTAVVLCKPGTGLTEAAVLDALKDRLAKYKLPKRVLFADDLPRNALGKVQKNVLRERHGDLYRGSR
ncbi:MAG TPA: malonyl-CoA synthase [Nevskiaceae bacterium]|nr:malonyl-CoA synthase [Nevskiaceae bacterium]